VKAGEEISKTVQSALGVTHKMCSLKLLLFCGAFILGFIVSETEGAQEAHCLLRGTEPYYWIRGEITFRQKNSDGVVSSISS
jgi:hypothetical protein